MPNFSGIANATSGFGEGFQLAQNQQALAAKQDEARAKRFEERWKAMQASHQNQAKMALDNAVKVMGSDLPPEQKDRLLGPLRQTYKAAAGALAATEQGRRQFLGEQGVAVEDPIGPSEIANGMMQTWEATVGTTQAPEQIQEREIAGKVAEQQALMPGEIQQAGQEAEARARAEARHRAPPQLSEKERTRQRHVQLRLAKRAGALDAAGKEELALLEADGSPFGASMAANMYSILVDAQAAKRRGESLSAGQRDQVSVALHYLQTPQPVRGANGEMQMLVPGVPQGMGNVLSDAGEAETLMMEPRTLEEAAERRDMDQLATSVGLPGGAKLVTVAEKDGDFGKQVSAVTQQISRIAQTLNAGASAGVRGVAKKILNPLARQAGIPADTGSEVLDRQLKTLQAIVGPIILQEKRISDTERARLKEIVGDLSVMTDELSIRESMGELLDIIEGIGKSK